MLTEQEQKNKDLVTEFWAYVMKQEVNPEKFKEFFSETNFTEHHQFGQGDGFEGLIKRFSWVFKAFPHFDIKVQSILADGDMVACRYVDKGVFAGEFLGMQPTGKPYVLDGMHFFRLEDGKIVEHWANVDDIHMFYQIGVLDQVVDSMNAQAV
jgi:predicted ester cyclase